MPRIRTMYMHTINRKAATWDGKNVVLCYQGPNAFLPVKLYRSLNTLSRHVGKTERQSGVHYGWMEVEVPQ
jgi:hypothetical protein